MNFNSCSFQYNAPLYSMFLHAFSCNRSNHRNLFNTKRKHTAFTLAETLVTLTIIGVIAAITIPNLISKYQKHTYVVGLKKAYSVLTNAFTMAVNEGDVTFKVGETEDDIKATIQRYLKIVKTCGTNNLSDCGVNNYPGYGSIWASTSYITEDGIIYTSTSTGIFADVNGPKGPNKAGRDIFYFEIAQEEY